MSEPSKDIDPRLLRTLVTVLRSGSVTRAAEELHTTQPSVSKALRRLESSVGFKLFERRGRTLHPTPRAQLLRENATRIERELEALRRSVAQIRHGRELGFSIAAVPAFVTTLLPRAIVKLRQIHPHATLKVEVWRRDQIITELDAGRVNIGLVHSSSEHVPSGFKIVACAPFRCVLPPGHRLCALPLVTADDLSKEKIVVYHNSLDMADALWRLLESLDPEPQVVVEASQSALLRDLVRHRVGIAVVDGFTAIDLTLDDMVTRPFKPTLPFYLAIASNSERLSVEACEFIAILEKEAREIAKTAGCDRLVHQ